MDGAAGVGINAGLQLHGLQLHSHCFAVPAPMACHYVCMQCDTQRTGCVCGVGMGSFQCLLFVCVWC